MAAATPAGADLTVPKVSLKRSAIYDELWFPRVGACRVRELRNAAVGSGMAGAISFGY